MRTIKLMNKIVAILLLIVVSSCEDFLDLRNPNVITPDTFFNSEDDFQLAVNTLYPAFNEVWNGAADAVNMRGDDVQLAAVDFSQFATYNNFTNDAANELSDYIWGNAYTVIFRANTILDEMETFEFSDPDFEEALNAELHFFRGASFFRLAHAYGDAPIPLVAAESQEQFNLDASPVADVYQQAIDDLLVAKAGLPDEQDEVGRATWGAATGFLGKLYLYRAGYLNDNASYALAAAQFKEIIDSGLYELTDDWLDNFLASTENNSESIFEAQYDIFSGSYNVTQPRPFTASVPGISGEIVSKPSAWILTEMSREMDDDSEYDERLLNTLYFEGGLPLFGVDYVDLGDRLECGSSGGGGGSGDGGSWFRKYLDVDLPCYIDNPVNNERILRYADVLLMYAEAVVMSGGSIDEAINVVNEIRSRANLPTGVDASGATLTASNIMDEIEHQRVMEFVMEGTRYFDLIRWGILTERLQAHGFPDESANVNEAKHKYFPIPLREVFSNEALDQNPLWE